MQRGSLVECINDKWPRYQLEIVGLTTFPVEKGIYTVRDAYLDAITHVPAIYLEEFMLPISPLSKVEIGWIASFFREIQPPMSISIDEFIKQPDTYEHICSH